MEVKFDIDKIVSYLTTCKNEINNYDWTSKVNDQEFVRLFGEKIKTENQSPIEIRLYLKNFIYEKIKNLSYDSTRFHEIAFWIVKHWGGINVREQTLRERLKDANFPKLKFENISSLSKILSFTDPQNLFIYDSRIAYALNWIILSKNAGELFFPVPPGRNTKVSAIDISLIIYLSKNKSQLQHFEGWKKENRNIYFNKDIVYDIFNNLIKDIHKELWIDDEDKQSEPCYTEMLLFSLADKRIFNEIIQSLKLDIS